VTNTGLRCDSIATALLGERLALGAGPPVLSLSAGCSGTTELLFNDTKVTGAVEPVRKPRQISDRAQKHKSWTWEKYKHKERK